MTWNGKRPQRAHFPAQFAPLSPPALSCSSRRSRQALRLGHELNAQRTRLGRALRWRRGTDTTPTEPVRIRAGVDGDLGPYRDPAFGLACTRHFRDGMSLSYPARFRPRPLFLRNVGRLLALCDIMSRSGGRLALCDIWHDQYLGRAESAASLGTSRRQDAPADDTGESTH